MPGPPSLVHVCSTVYERVSSSTENDTGGRSAFASSVATAEDDVHRHQLPTGTVVSQHLQTWKTGIHLMPVAVIVFVWGEGKGFVLTKGNKKNFALHSQPLTFSFILHKLPNCLLIILLSGRFSVSSSTKVFHSPAFSPL